MNAVDSAPDAGDEFEFTVEEMSDDDTSPDPLYVRLTTIMK